MFILLWCDRGRSSPQPCKAGVRGIGEMRCRRASKCRGSESWRRMKQLGRHLGAHAGHRIGERWAAVEIWSSWRASLPPFARGQKLERRTRRPAFPAGATDEAGRLGQLCASARDFRARLRASTDPRQRHVSAPRRGVEDEHVRRAPRRQWLEASAGASRMKKWMSRDSSACSTAGLPRIRRFTVIRSSANRS